MSAALSPDDVHVGDIITTRHKKTDGVLYRVDSLGMVSAQRYRGHKFRALNCTNLRTGKPAVRYTDDVRIVGRDLSDELDT